MTILGLDAALGGFSAALLQGEASTSVATGRQDALETGIAELTALLTAAGLGLRDLDRIAVGVGPGSFTGLRIAIAYAKSLAYAARVPLVGISSYDALEPDDADEPVLTVVHGRRGIICARLRAAGESRTACGPIAEVLDRLLASPPGPLQVAGRTEDVLAQIAERGWTVRVLPPRADVPALAIALLARHRVPSPTPHALAPDYGESPAVTLNAGPRGESRHDPHVAGPARTGAPRERVGGAEPGAERR
ncbi:MAG TPA: tRNA (adenosine(37)-N6)-threonylcarbamoyltransferase complex dimerization subunit type 1 TsaB [Candidatus Sulfotelmatobacter sp.]|nr:tRNA (adenosine(37)-N6)-threonylcarbamoyltransferase complex dimerization subunit type 1 TsaB [Candidatus Sulfotelmatobacter sp.]